ncbi:MAG: serine/threonine-protein kinase [Nocardiopsaceae bacterium]|nr:serine/threonine-protein kinase [Nocardiopsaceae bacterium]
MHPREDTDPRQIGGIEVLGRLGKGGMGRVYLGRTEDGDRVAVKTMHKEHADNPAAMERFSREISAMSMVCSPGVAELVAASAADADPRWLAMEYVPGLTLREHVDRSGVLDGPAATALALLLAEALAAIHGAGLLHRDLKPANVMLGPEGPKVIDFGLVAIGGAGGELTGSRTTLGTPLCMAPEQIATPATVAEPADVYGLGAVLVFASAGHYPVMRESRDALLAAVALSSVPRDVSGVPGELAPLVERMLAVDPAERPGVGEVRAELRELLAASGRIPAAARADLARATYVPGPDDPEPPAAPAPARLRRRTATADSPTGPKNAAAVRAAERLRRAYARPPAA